MCHLTFLFLIITLVFVPTDSYISVPSTEVVFPEECLTSIIKETVRNNTYLVSVLEGNLANIILSQGIATIIYSISNNNTGLDLNKATGYLLFLDKTNSASIFQYLSSTSTWNPRATFFIYSKNETASDILKEGYKYYALDIFVLNINKSINKIDIYAWSTLRQCGKPKEIILLDSCTQDKPMNSSIFQQQILTSTWKNCTLRILPIQIHPFYFKISDGGYEGLDLRAVQMIQRKLQFTTVYLKNEYTTWGLKTADGRYSRMFGILQKYDADLMIGMLPQNYTHVWDFDATHPLMRNSVSWVVPRAKVLPHWKTLFRIYPQLIWTSCFLMLIIFPILWKVPGKLLSNIERDCFGQWKTCFLYSFSVLLTISVPLQPKTSTVRIIFLVWVFIDLLFTTLYQTRLISTLTKPIYEHQISNMDELLDSDLNLGMNINLKSIFGNEIKGKPIMTCDLTLTCMNKTAFERNMAMAKTQLVIRYLALKYFANPDGSYKVYMFPNSLLMTYVTLVFSRGHPMYKDFNKYMRKIPESGMIVYWIHDIEHILKLKFLKRNNTDKQMALSLKQMTASFIVLLLGLSIAIVIFVAEQICFKFYN